MKQKIMVLLLIWGIVISPMQAAEDCLCPCECEEEEQLEYSSDIIVSEMLPNPSGSESEGEWIELKNEGTEDVDLCGWQIKDASTKIYTISADDFDSTIIEPGDYFVIERQVSLIALNNTGDEVNLYQPDENLIETVEYADSAEEDYSYAREDNDWYWTDSPTPGDENNINIKVEPEVSPESEETEEEENMELEPETEINYDFSDNIIINEIYANPNSGETEFIELKNVGSREVDLNGWKLSDRTSKIFTISTDDYTSTKIDKYFVVYGNVSGLALNNSGDDVELYQPDDSLLELVEYVSGEKGQSYSLVKDEWSWSDEATPGQDNILNLENQDEQDESEEEEANETIEYDFSKKLEITEVLPDPEGADTTDEFIEIYNGDDKEVNLIGWGLSDNSKTFIWDENVVLKPGKYKAFYASETKISLNNSGETISLINFKEKVISEVIYEGSESGLSYCKNNETWQWSSSISPGEKNVIVEQTNIEETEEAENSENDNSDEYQLMSVKQAREKEKDSKVQIEGIVSVEPGVLGAQFFYIQDNEAGVQVYSSKKYFPEGMKIGDKVIVAGKVSEASNEKKINISTEEDIEIVGSSGNLEVLETEELSEDLEGKLVLTESQILELASNKIMLANGVLVYIKSGVEFTKSDYTEGDVIAVTGIVGQYKEDYRLMPRGVEDIEILSSVAGGEEERIINAEQAAKRDQGENLLSKINKDNKIAIYLLVAIGVLLIGLVAVIYKTGIWKEWREKLIVFLAGGKRNTTAKDALSRCRE